MTEVVIKNKYIKDENFYLHGDGLSDVNIKNNKFTS